MQYRPPKFLFNGHLETIFPSIFRRVNFRPPQTEIISTPDNDFLELDCYRQKSLNCLIISHGLEGNSSRAYVRGMARAFYNIGYDIVSYNLRGCGNNINRQNRFYHSGASDDLSIVINHVSKKYKFIFLIGFSLGGNITLKYLGEDEVHPKIKKSVVISVPLHLHSCSLKLATPENYFYSKRFLNSLKKKVSAKKSLITDYPPTLIQNIRSIFEFDDIVTGPLHGFKNAIDYYNQCSGINYIIDIRVPTLILNATNDPFLSKLCFPKSQTKNCPIVKVLTPRFGGHVGFSSFNKSGLFWSEKMAIQFMEEREV